MKRFCRSLACLVVVLAGCSHSQAAPVSRSAQEEDVREAAFRYLLQGRLSKRKS